MDKRKKPLPANPVKVKKQGQRKDMPPAKSVRYADRAMHPAPGRRGYETR